MQNLKLEGDKYLYRTGNMGKVIEFEVDYTLGGYGFFGSAPRQRGIEITIRPIEYLSEDLTRYSFSIGGNDRVSGGYIFVEPLARKNAKKTLRAAEFFDEIAPMVAGMWKDNMPEAKRLLFERVEEFKKQYLVQVAA